MRSYRIKIRKLMALRKKMLGLRGSWRIWRGKEGKCFRKIRRSIRILRIFKIIYLNLQEAKLC